MKKNIMDICETIVGMAMLAGLCTTEYINELHAWLGLSVALVLTFGIVAKIVYFVIGTIKKRKERS